MTNHTNFSNIRSWLGPRRLSCTGACPMANAKIISFVDSMLDAQARQLNADIEATRDKAVHDIGFIALNIRHDIKILNDLIRQQRQDLTALATAVDQLRQELTATAADFTTMIRILRHDVDQLKQGGEGLPVSD